MDWQEFRKALNHGKVPESQAIQEFVERCEKAAALAERQRLLQQMLAESRLDRPSQEWAKRQLAELNDAEA